ncbi:MULTISPECIES: glutathione transferase [unclassified Achromobacter]|uniref:glutathione transferase n=1 Tax=unclassified Achromobacter TaxID=2626865 RepID=UPI000B5184F4|nr:MULTISPECIES: glutathione transferase [unclassified Achromobacter]OWT75330.1 glutathione S-transferase [Achromobacter sp. HZ28]OWT75990.1 glutathione S-transferase [Achromobacter sp. HZ34]
MAVPLTLYIDNRLLSPWAMSAYVALVEKNLDFELRLVDLDQGEQRMAPFLCRSPAGKVPVLAHHDFYLSESSAIVEYLEEAFPAPEYAAVIPADTRARARMRQVQAWLRSDLAALRRERPTEVVFEGMQRVPLSDEGQADATRLVRVAGCLLQEGQKHLFDDWCIADADLALMLNRLILSREEVPARLRDYAAEQWERPSLRRWRDSRGA